ncbi:hypothetical protein BDY17DRAFT_102684 [Neohortaea acidophila]|uniref:Uncharacterized protein n=1 Tax=Neohortaea acidophila TaxID=245834 RepID=A0A6A6Q087_9PEZI|nr:uncharacterized protein BDY17DRAFT_102684 [Neohortaea acidophila]KAF2485406.1 hypothetical protein BDY17DRAFT_102684 [Neohortaea acidophila]
MESEDEDRKGASRSSTPDSNAVDASGAKVSKDRACPFCAQAFTSSSLGRHLDLYIKPRNPKPPDGVHDVDEIRRIRGRITRRQPRTSAKTAALKEEVERQDSPGTASGEKRHAEPARSVHSPALSDARTPLPPTSWHATNWQATGVINNLPPRVPSRTSVRAPLPSIRRIQDASMENHVDTAHRPGYDPEDIGKLHEAAEVGRAAEMALREVMGSLEAARKRIASHTPFDDFDFYSLAFPGLCLAMLPPPPTLFSSTPFPLAHTWAVAPPGERQMAALQSALHKRLASIREADPSSLPDSEAFKMRVHLESAWEHWRGLPSSEQAAAWNLEVCRAFAKEGEKTTRLSAELDTAHQRIAHLEAEYDRLSRCQLPRDYLLHPPNTISVSPGVMDGLKTTDLKSGARDVNYDAEALLNKWKGQVKQTMRPPRPPTFPPMHVDTSRNQLKGDIVLNGSLIGVGGPMPRNEESSYQSPSNEERSVRQYDKRAELEELDAERSRAPQSGGAASSYHLARTPRTSDSPHPPPPEDGVNVNGKRPRWPEASMGREPGPKVYREQAP